MDMKKIRELLVMIGTVTVLLTATGCGNDNETRGRMIGESVGTAIRDLKATDTLFTAGSDNEPALTAKASVSTDSTAYGGETTPAITVNVYESNGLSRFDAGMIIPVVGIVFGVMCPVLIVLVIMVYIYKICSSRNRVIEAAVARGIDVPASAFTRSRTPRARLNSAMVWLGVGLGLIAMGAMMEDADFMGIGAVPMFIGIGKLVTYILEDRKKGSDATTEVNEDAHED